MFHTSARTALIVASSIIVVALSSLEACGETAVTNTSPGSSGTGGTGSTEPPVCAVGEMKVIGMLHDSPLSVDGESSPLSLVQSSSKGGELTMFFADNHLRLTWEGEIDVGESVRLTGGELESLTGVRRCVVSGSVTLADGGATAEVLLTSFTLGDVPCAAVDNSHSLHTNVDGSLSLCTQNAE